MLPPEIKKGSAEFLILSLLRYEPRHGYELSKLIETRSGGVVQFQVSSLYPLLYRMEGRGWIRGRWVEKARPAPPPLLQHHPRGPHRRRRATRELGGVRPGDRQDRGARQCLIGVQGSTIASPRSI